MNLLLDTNVFLWWMTGSRRLRPAWDELLRNRANTVLVSSISVAEIAIKSSLEKLPPPPGPVSEAVEQAGFQELPFTMDHGQTLGTLPWHHKDPFDRMIIAQALTEGLPVATADPVFRNYGLMVITAD
jgi:PIN domain nuclease of toxin-antitoxin system